MRTWAPTISGSISSGSRGRNGLHSWCGLKAIARLLQSPRPCRAAPSQTRSLIWDNCFHWLLDNEQSPPRITDPIPKTGIPQNKSVLRVKFFVPENMVAKHHVSPHISPQIHHQNTTFFRLIFPKTSAKHHKSPTQKKFPNSFRRALRVLLQARQL